MFKKTINYTDFNGTKRSDDFYFHMTRTDLLTLEASKDGGLENLANKIIATNDKYELIKFFKELINLSYGLKTHDGKFKKSDTILEDFTSSQAYDELFMELAQDAGAAADFFNGIVPAELREEAAKIREQQANNVAGVIAEAKDAMH